MNAVLEFFAYLLEIGAACAVAGSLAVGGVAVGLSFQERFGAPGKRRLARRTPPNPSAVKPQTFAGARTVARLGSSSRA